MATIPPPAFNARNLGEYQRQVRSPLARLRGYIYLYVGVEAALVFVLLTAACFWAGLLADFGLFKLYGFDWVQQPAWTWWLRLGVFIAAAVGVVGLVTWMVLSRLMREFSDPALALVLERRFPAELGDRLITAVELSDLRRAVEQGYSPAMVVETIHEAAERVGKVPVGQVFDWGRLLRRGLVALAVTAGLYAAVGALYLSPISLFCGAYVVVAGCILAAAASVFVRLIRQPNRAQDAMRVAARSAVLAVLLVPILALLGYFGADHFRSGGRVGYGPFHETTVMWAERNLLMRRSVWPRRAQLVFLNVPESGLWAGVGGAAPQVHLKALQYVIAAPETWDGWRALTWDDLTKRPDLIGPDVPGLRLKARAGDSPLTVDDVVLKLGKLDAQADAAGEGPAGWEVAVARTDPPEWRPLKWADLALVKDALDHVAARAAAPEMGRTLRRLELPEKVFLSSYGCKGAPQPELKRGDENEYTYEFTKLEFEPTDKQRVVHFSVRAADYTTPQRTVTVVDPPDLEGVRLEESRPAYLYYPPRPTEKPEDAVTLAFLRGKKQLIEASNILPRDSASARIDVPAGTDLVLTGAATEDLKEAFLDLTPGKADKEATSLRVRLDPANVRPGDPRSGFLVGGDPASADARWADAAVSARPLPGDGWDWLLQTTRRDEVKNELAHGEPLRLPLQVVEDANHKKRQFRVELSDVRRSLSLALEFAGPEGIVGSKRLEVQVQPDAAPVIQDVSVVGLRSEARVTPDGDKRVFYYVTPRARIPVSGRVGDDHSLGGVQYRVTIRPVAPAPPPEPGKPPKPAPDLPGRDYVYEPPGFGELTAQDGLPVGEVLKLLDQPQRLPYRQPLLLRSADLHADTINVGYDAPKPPQRPAWRDAQDPSNKLHWDLPLWQYGVAIDDDHPLYRMDLRLEAADTDADDQTAPDGSPLPHRSQSSATYTFLLVRDNFLKGLIGQDEAKQYKDLNAQFQNLAGLSTDVGVFKREAQSFADHLLKEEKQPDKAAQVLAFLEEVSTKVETAHRVADPEKFLMNSPAYKTLSEAVKAGTEQNERDEKALDANPPAAEAERLREEIRSNDEFKDSVGVLTALVRGMREEKSSLTLLTDNIANVEATLKANPKLKAGDVITSEDVQSAMLADSLDHALETTRRVVAAYEGLVREEQLNVLDKDSIDYTQKHVLDKLHVIQKQDYPFAAQAIARFRKSLTDKTLTDEERIDGARKAAPLLQDPMTRLVADLSEVLEAISGGKSRQSLKDTLTKIDDQVVDERKYAQDVENWILNHIFDEPGKP